MGEVVRIPVHNGGIHVRMSEPGEGLKESGRLPLPLCPVQESSGVWRSFRQARMPPGPVLFVLAGRTGARGARSSRPEASRKELSDRRWC